MDHFLLINKEDKSIAPGQGVAAYIVRSRTCEGALDQQGLVSGMAAFATFEARQDVIDPFFYTLYHRALASTGLRNRNCNLIAIAGMKCFFLRNTDINRDFASNRFYSHFSLFLTRKMQNRNPRKKLNFKLHDKAFKID